MPTTTADTVGLLQCVGLGCAAYIASIGAWRWLTYEARCVVCGAVGLIMFLVQSF